MIGVTAGGGANWIGVQVPPRISVSSSRTILMTCCAGVRLAATSAPAARSSIRRSSSLATL